MDKPEILDSPNYLEFFRSSLCNSAGNGVVGMLDCDRFLCADCVLNSGAPETELREYITEVLTHDKS